MKKNIVVYIASPYTLGDPLDNVNKSLDCWEELVKRGYTPFAPLLTHYIEEKYHHEAEFWYEYDNIFLDRCDCVLRLDGKSWGADQEVKRARANGMPVLYTIDQLDTYYEEYYDYHRTDEEKS
jgi:nucleoside 2-deoxyribosyltransferase